MKDEVTFEDIWTMYQTVWGEARGETFQGKKAVAYVILNRVKDPRWPNNPHDVCRDKWQFSAWNADNPNRKKMVVLPLDDLHKECMEAVMVAVTGYRPDITEGATHYFAAYIDTPRWATQMQETTKIGPHRFFK